MFWCLALSDICVDMQGEVERFRGAIEQKEQEVEPLRQTSNEAKAIYERSLTEKQLIEERVFKVQRQLESLKLNEGEVRFQAPLMWHMTQKHFTAPLGQRKLIRSLGQSKPQQQCECNQSPSSSGKCFSTIAHMILCVLYAYAPSIIGSMLVYLALR